MINWLHPIPSIRERRLSRQDALAKRATTLAGELPETERHIFSDLEEVDNSPLVVDFAALRSCRASLGCERALATDSDALVETVAQHAYEAGTLQHWSGATLPMRRRVLGGVRKGLEAAGVIRP